MSIDHTTAHDRSDDEFSRDFGEMFEYISDQVCDPHVEYIHGYAQAAANYINTHCDDADALVEPLSRAVDKRWMYVDQTLAVTAPVWVINGETGRFVTCAKLVDEEVLSKGFIIKRKAVGASGEEIERLPFQAAHYVHLPPAQHWPQGAHGVIFLDDITHITLPYPSEEMRAKNLQYSRPDIAVAVETIAGHAGRPDQILKDLKSLTFRLDSNLERDEELLKDIGAFLNQHVTVEANVNYRMEVEGDIVRIDDKSIRHAERCLNPWQMVTQIKRVAILPEVNELENDEPGVKVYQVYLHVDVLSSGGGRDDDMLIPCASLNWISSSRYDQAMPPTYAPEVPNE
jgi:hypothetical protein